MNNTFERISRIRDNYYNGNVYKFYRDHFKGPLKYVSSVLSWTVFCILIISAIFLIYYFVSAKIYETKGAGYEPEVSLYTIISPSMVPNINVYDVVIVNKVSQPSDIKVGDVISYNSSSFTPGEVISITHRVIEIMIDSDGNYSYFTKGDNNFVRDPEPVNFNQIMGVVGMKIPRLGEVQFFLASGTGWLLVIAIPALIIIIRSLLKIVGISKIGQKISKNSKYFNLFNKPLLLSYRFNKVASEGYNNYNDLPAERPTYDNYKSLEEIYNDLNNISK